MTFNHVASRIDMRGSQPTPQDNHEHYAEPIVLAPAPFPIGIMSNAYVHMSNEG
jgi:hypothetical protein